MKPLLSTNNIGYSYDGKIDVLTNITFSLYPGEDVAIIGHNGSGKSTLAKIFTKLIKPKKGELFIDGKVGIVFQNPDNQFVGATVRDDIAFGLENMCVPREEMDEIINYFAERVGMLDCLDKEPNNLSGGQKQRVAIAGILAMNPDIVIFDEALSMLDPKGKSEIKNLIEEIKKSNPKLAIIRITHDIEEAYSCDNILVLDKGHEALFGKPEEIFAKTDVLKDLGLNVPFALELSNRLVKDNLIKKKSSSIEEIIEQLCH